MSQAYMSLMSKGPLVHIVFGFEVSSFISSDPGAILRAETISTPKRRDSIPSIFNTDGALIPAELIGCCQLLLAIHNLSLTDDFCK